MLKEKLGMRVVSIGITFLVIAGFGFFFAQHIREEKYLPLEKENWNVVPQIPFGPIESYPLELTMHHFATMKLEGKDLQKEKLIRETTAFQEYEITYRSNDVKISGVVYIPKKGDVWPLIVANHGYYKPEKYKVGEGLPREEEYLVSHGYIVAHSDYRGHGDSDHNPDKRNIYDSELGYDMDVVNLIEALKKSPLASQIDFQNVGMMGHSMGGEISLDIAVAYPIIAKVFILYSAANGDAWKNFSRWPTDDENITKTTLDIIGSPAKNPEFWRKISSSSYLNRIKRPIYTFHGGDDSTVPAMWSKLLYLTLKDMGKEAHYTLYREQPHEFQNSRDSEFCMTIGSIFDRYLKH